jgi:protein transport protein SEC24
VQMYLYIGPAASDAVISDVLNISGWNALPPPNEPLQLPRLDPNANSLNAAANALIDNARTRARCYMRLRIVCRGRPEERHFHSLVAEDRAADSMSYIEFLCHVHKRISTAISRR